MFRAVDWRGHIGEQELCWDHRQAEKYATSLCPASAPEGIAQERAERANQMKTMPLARGREKDMMN